MSIQQYTTDQLGATATGNHAEYRADCISCGKPDHLYVNVAKGVAHCFVCGYSANIIRLIQDLEGCDYPTALIRLSQIQAGLQQRRPGRCLDALYQMLLLSVEDAVEAQHVTLPKYTVPINAVGARRARKYLEGRGFFPQHYRLYDLCYVEEQDEEAPRFFKHIVFPIYDAKGRLAYYTTRATYEPHTAPKSYNATGTKGSLVFGADPIPELQRTAILVEGPMDAMALTRFGVASLGKELSKAQARAIAQRFDRVYVCYDAGESFDSAKAATLLKQHECPEVLIARCPWKDPAEGVAPNPLSTIHQCMRAAVPFDLGGKLHARMDYKKH